MKVQQRLWREGWRAVQLGALLEEALDQAIRMLQYNMEGDADRYVLTTVF